MERFLVMLQLATEVAHPVDVGLSVAHIEGSWVVPLAKFLILSETVKNAVHGHLSLEFLVGCSDTLHYVLSVLLLLSVAIPGRLLNGSLILESATGRAIAQVTVAVVLEEVGLSVLAIEAVELDDCTLSFVFWLGLLRLVVFLFSSEGEIN